MHRRGLRRPTDGDDSRCFVGLDQLDNEHIGRVDRAVAKGVIWTLGFQLLVSWDRRPGRCSRTDRATYWVLLIDLGHHPLRVRVCVQTAGYVGTLEVTTGRHRPEIYAQPRTGEHCETLKETGLA